MAGLYSDRSRKSSAGFMLYVYDVDSQQTLLHRYHPYPPQLIYKLTGKDTSKAGTELFSFDASDMVVTYDGGLVLVAESSFNDAESYEVPSFAPSVTPSFRTVRINYYNDIIVFSIRPDGSINWHKILRKKQVSEDDEGFFSSYHMSTTNDALRFVYNEEIYFKTNINEYILDNTGGLERENILNAGDYDVMLVPRLAKQISGDEVIIPSFRRNFFNLVKIKFYPQ